MECVLDSSMALAWALPDETSERAERLLSQISPKGALWVPALWWYEVGNALLAAQRRRRLAEADRLRALELYGSLPLQTDALLGPTIVERFQALAQTYGLSAYNAAYLELAQRKDLELATLDQPLMAAARRAGVHLVRLP
jgi:predicted nucleic acid-binding protein